MTDNKEDQCSPSNDSINVGVSLSSSEVVGRYGSANEEYVKGYSGIDNESGQRFTKGLLGISKHKINLEYAEQNIKQQAGYSAEVAATSKDNAEAIIKGSKIRTSRSDDLPQYGKNHSVVDRVKIINGEIIEGSQSQMKFVKNCDELFEKIAKEDGKFARYRGVKLELPSEQYEGAAQRCREKASDLRRQADAALKSGKTDVATKCLRKADNYDQLANNVSDSGLTTKQAIFYREHPKLATALDIAHTSHRAGLEAVNPSFVIGGAISIFQNSISVAQGKKAIDDAFKGVVLDTAKAGALGYSTAAVGAAAKGLMQQSKSQVLTALAKTSAPTLIVNTCLSLSGAVKRYVSGEISEADFLVEVGEKGANMLSSGMMAAMGQLAIPIPVVGAVLGGMIGCALSSFFYQSALDAAQGVEVSREILARTQAIQEAARNRLAEEQAIFDEFISREIPQLQSATRNFFENLNKGCSNTDEFAVAINGYAAFLGKELEFTSMKEFDEFMNSDRPLTI